MNSTSRDKRRDRDSLRSPSITGAFRARQILKTAWYMLLMGTLISYAAFEATPFAISWEFEQATVKSLPRYGLLIGLVLGLSMGLSTAVRRVIFAIFGFVAFGGFLWIMSVIFIGGALILVGVPEPSVDRIMDWVGPAAFLLAILLGCVGVFAASYDKVNALLARFRSKQENQP